jgi:hypothetical protein
MRNKIQVCIINHEKNENARKLRDLFSRDFDCVVLDSGSSEKDESFVLLDNIYYSGLFNRAVEETQANRKEWLFLICSDVEIEESEYWKIARRMENQSQFIDVGVYSPSSHGRSHHFCKSQHTRKMRDVPMVEGFIFMARIDILKKMYPVDLVLNKLGWGLDAMKGFLCHQNGFRCVIDDSILVYHPAESGYDGGEAMNQMKRYVDSRGIDFRNYIRSKIGFKI